ncbi:MAG: hypothetical protein AAF600_10965 [Bacteroidota bacterium]
MIIEFTKGFGGAKKGDVLEFDTIMASKLINKYKCAKLYKGDKKPKNENKNAAPKTEIK